MPVCADGQAWAFFLFNTQGTSHGNATARVALHFLYLHIHVLVRWPACWLAQPRRYGPAKHMPCCLFGWLTYAVVAVKLVKHSLCSGNACRHQRISQKVRSCALNDLQSRELLKVLILQAAVGRHPPCT